MNEIKSSRHYGRLLFLCLLIGIPILLFLNIGLIFRVLLVLSILVTIVVTSTIDIEINNEVISIDYPFNFFIKKKKIQWITLFKVEVVFRDGLTHGAMMPSYINFDGPEINERINYRLTKSELQTLRNLSHLNNVKFKCFNEPYGWLD